MNTHYDLSICIVSYNTKGLVRSCINSVKEKTLGISYQIIVVDNASKDGTPEMIEKDFPEVLLIRGPKNLGFPSGVNLALPHVKSRYLVLFNSDTELINDAFTELLSFMDQHPECGIACPQLYYPDGRVQTSQYPFRDPVRRAYWELSPRIRELKYVLRINQPEVAKKKPKRVPPGPTEIQGPRGVCYMIRTECVRQIGPMDGNLFLFSDEVDWSYRASKAGWKRYLVPAAKVEHIDHASVSKQATMMEKIKIQSMYYYNYKHHGFTAWLRIRLGYLFGSLLAYVLYLLSSLIGQGNSQQPPQDHLMDARRLFVLATLTKKVVPPDAV